MKTTFTPSLYSLLFSSVTFFGLAVTSPAASKTWDNGTTNFIWDVGASSNWTGSTWANGDTARFENTGIGTVELNETILSTLSGSSGIIFTAGGYTIADTNNDATLTFNATIANAGTIAGLNTSGSNIISESLSLTGNSGPKTFRQDAGGSLTISGNITAGTGIGASFTNTVSGTGNIILTGTNSFQNTIGVGTGTAANKTNLQLGNGGTSGTLSSSSGLSLNASGTLIINRSNTVTQGVDFTSSAISGSGNFVQAGGGTTTLNVVNSYTGSTTVSAGTLLLSSSLGGTNGITVSGGALASTITNANLGTGSLTLSSGSIAPGDSSIGSFTLASNQVLLTTGGTLAMDVDTQASLDQIFGSGAGSGFTLSNTTLALNLISFGAADYALTYSLFSGFNSGSISGLSISGYDSVNYIASFANDGSLSFTAIPEASAAMYLFIGLFGLVTLRRKF